MQRKKLVNYLADVLTWGLSLVAIGAAWWQTVRLLSAYAEPGAEWWSYLAATAIEGGIIVAGLVLMSERNGYSPAVALLVFMANVALSVVAQVAEAALTSGQALPDWVGVVVTYAAPASVTVIGAALWTLKILRSWQDEPGEDAPRVRDVRSPAQLPLPLPQVNGSPKAEAAAPARRGRPRG